MTCGLDTGLREAFPEFASKEKYPEGVVTLWGNVARRLLNAARWRDLYPLGIFLYVAHNLVLSKQAAAGNSGGGVVTGKSVGDVSINYDAAITAYENAGLWNQTSYGKRFWELQQIMGAGPIQVGTGGFPFDLTPQSFHNGGAGLLAINGPPFADEAWVGPQFWPGNGLET